MADPKLVDMAYTKAELKEEAKERGISPTGQPDPYPWGLCLRLESDELKKLGITDLPNVGDEFHLLAIAKVTGCTSSAREGQDEETSVALQITMMQVLLKEAAAAEKGEKDSPKSEAKETPSLLISKYKE